MKAESFRVTIHQTEQQNRRVPEDVYMLQLYWFIFYVCEYLLKGMHHALCEAFLNVLEL